VDADRQRPFFTSASALQPPKFFVDLLEDSAGAGDELEAELAEARAAVAPLKQNGSEPALDVAQSKHCLRKTDATAALHQLRFKLFKRRY
jgi:hypothetical protein